MMELTTANVSTIATWIAIAITGILGYLGIEYDYTALIPVISGIITLIIAIWSSKNPNEIKALGNGKNEITTEEEAIDDGC